MKGFWLLILAVPSLCFSQSNLLPTDSSGYIVFESVVREDSSLKAGQLYAGALTWFAKNFTKNVIQTQVPETRTIVANALAPTKWINSFNVEEDETLEFRLTLDFKDGRYKYVLDKLVLLIDDERYPGLIEETIAKKKKQSAKAAAYINSSVQEVLKSLEKALSHSENW